MDRDLLSHLPIVISVARHRGFAAAAAQLGMSASAVSHAVRTVEDRLGEPLFARTTRSVSLTEAGTRFLANVGPALDDIGKAVEGLAADRGEIAGHLRLNAPRVAMPMAMTTMLAKLALLHPSLTTEVHINDGFVDIVAGGYDAGIRLGEAVQQDMVGVRLTKPFKAILVASPSYLEARGAPRGIADLRHHNCIGYRLIASGSLYDWDLKDGTQEVAAKTRGTVQVTDSTVARELALAGIGIAYIFEPLVRQDVREGRLKWLLPHSAVQEEGLFLYFPRRASMAPKLRAFVDVVRNSTKRLA